MRKEEESLTHSHFTATERKEGIVVAIQLFSFSSFSPFPPISHLDLGMKEKREREMKRTNKTTTTTTQIDFGGFLASLLPLLFIIVLGLISSSRRASSLRRGRRDRVWRSFSTAVSGCRQAQTSSFSFFLQRLLTPTTQPRKKPGV